MFGIKATLAAVFAAVFVQVAVRGAALAQPAAAAASVGDSVQAQSVQAQSTYKLGSGDQLALLILDEPQFTGNFFVGPDGNLSLPWLGDVPAQGRTVHDVRADIEARLKSGFIVNPGVSLQVIAFRPFFILGEVNKPGQYPYVAGMTARAAIATAGGFTYRAKTSSIFLKHPGEEKEAKVPLTAATKVYPGDIVRVAESYF